MKVCKYGKNVIKNRQMVQNLPEDHWRPKHAKFILYSVKVNQIVKLDSVKLTPT